MPRIAIAFAAIVALYGAQVWAAHDSGNDPKAVHAAVMIGCGLLQSALLLWLFNALRGRPVRFVLLSTLPAIVLLAVLSGIASNTDDDASAYMAYAKLPSFADAYAGPQQPSFSGGGFERIAQIWPRLPPLVYGPLWLAADRFLIGHAPTYDAALAILRGVNAVLIGLLAFALRRAGCDPATVAIAAVNPMLWFYFVIQAHNDLAPIVLIVAGIAIARTRPLLGTLVAAVAALIKIVFIALAALPSAGRRRWHVVLGYWATAIILVAAISWAFGGAPYMHAMALVGRTQIATRTDAAHLLASILHLAVAAVAAVAIVAAIARNVFVAPATYAFAAISTIVYPWYLGWCIPYAVRIPSFAATFFISAPAVAHLIDPHFSLSPSRSFAVLPLYYVVVIAACGYGIARRARVTAAE